MLTFAAGLLQDTGEYVRILSTAPGSDLVRRGTTAKVHVLRMCTAYGALVPDSELDGERWKTGEKDAFTVSRSARPTVSEYVLLGSVCSRILSARSVAAVRRRLCRTVINETRGSEYARLRRIVLGL